MELKKKTTAAGQTCLVGHFASFTLRKIKAYPELRPLGQAIPTHIVDKKVRYRAEVRRDMMEMRPHLRDTRLPALA